MQKLKRRFYLKISSSQYCVNLSIALASSLVDPPFSNGSEMRATAIAFFILVAVQTIYMKVIFVSNVTILMSYLHFGWEKLPQLPLGDSMRIIRLL